MRTVLKVLESKYQSYIIAITCFNEQVLFVGPVVLVLRCRVKDVVLAVVVACVGGILGRRCLISESANGQSGDQQPQPMAED